MSSRDDELAAFLVGADDDDLADVLDGLPDHVVAALLAATPSGDSPTWASPLDLALDLDPTFVDLPHLRAISDELVRAVADVRAGKTRQIVVSLPPRSGKSTLVSTWFPLWLLATRPFDRPLSLGLVSSSPALSSYWSRNIRRVVEDGGGLFGALTSDSRAVMDWETVLDDRVVARSVGQNIIGMGFNVLVLDDVVKDAAAAHSATERAKVWDWWTGTAAHRVERPALVLVVACLVGETPVLLADGSSRRIDEVRPGDRVVSWDDGWTEGVVKNWAPQGLDTVYAIRTSSGREVRANGKHMFLVETAEGRQWRRTDTLGPGDAILATGGAGGGLPARSTAAASLSPVKDSAGRTITSRDGRRGTDGALLRLTETRPSATATGSGQKTSTGSPPSREEYAPSAPSYLTSPTPLGTGRSSSSITITRPVRSEGCSATPATSPSGMGEPPNVSTLPLLTYVVTTDEVVSVETVGQEEVFDIEVEGAHTFVADGLVTHNTRWHEDDLTARLLSEDFEGNPDDWTELTFPAIAETPPGAGPEWRDPVGRADGDPLASPLAPDETREEGLERWGVLRETVGAYTWSAVFQQRPAPAGGLVFDAAGVRYWTTDPARVAREPKTTVLLPPDPVLRDPSTTWLDSWDLAGTEGGGDYTVGQRWAKVGPTSYLVDQVRGRWAFTGVLERVRDFSTGGGAWGDLPRRRLIEAASVGPAVIDTLSREVSGVIPAKPRGSKVERATAVTPAWETGHIVLPHPREPGYAWVSDLVAEILAFPSGAHDDQVDAMTQARSAMEKGRAATLATTTTELATRRIERPSPSGGRRIERARIRR